MARGYPDYFGYSSFPHYGQLLLDTSGSIFVAAGAVDTIFDLTLKGQIAGGFLVLQNVQSPNLTDIILTFDGTEIYNFPIKTVYDYNVGQNDMPLKLCYYNDVEYFSYFNFIREYPFGNQFKLEVDNGSAVIVTVQSLLYYYQVKT